MCNVKNHRINKKSYYTTRSKIFSIFMAAVVGFAVVSYWRGVWMLWDQFIFPNNEKLSAIMSLATGVSILIFLKSFFSVLAPPIPTVNIHLDRSENKKNCENDGGDACPHSL